MFTRARHFLFEDTGATAIEYGLICALLVLSVAATLPTFGMTLRDVYQRVNDAFSH